MGMTLEGEFWEGKMYSPTWNYSTIAHFFLSMTSSAANICLVLAFCDSKLGWVFKYPSAILAAVWCTISYAQYQVLFHGYGTRFLTAQLPFELVTFATAMPGAGDVTGVSIIAVLKRMWTNQINQRARDSLVDWLIVELGFLAMLVNWEVSRK